MDIFDLPTEELKAGIKDIATTELIRMKNDLQENLAVPGNINPRYRPAALANKRLIHTTLMTRAGQDPSLVRDEHGNPVTPPTDAEKQVSETKQKAHAEKVAAATHDARQSRTKEIYEAKLSEGKVLGYEDDALTSFAEKQSGYSPPADGD